MKLTAKVVPFSSIVGSSVMLHDESGNVVCQLALLNTARGDDPSEWRRQQEALAQEVASRFLSTPVSAASPEGEAEALAWFAKNISLELSWGPVSDDECDVCQWCVHERRGNVNDQEWELVGHGDTPIAAINDARHAAVPSTQEKNRG